MTVVKLRYSLAIDQAGRQQPSSAGWFSGAMAALRATSCACAALALVSGGAVTTIAVPKASAETSVKSVKHKIRSAHFVVNAVTKKGFKVENVRRKAQVYFVKVNQGGSTAILAIDGYSSEIIGLTLLKAAAGATLKVAGSGPRHYVDILYPFGYIVTESVYASYTSISSTEISSTSSYSYASYAESEEVSYEEVEHDESADLDEGTTEDTAGDAEASANDDADDGAADDNFDTNDTNDNAADGGSDNDGASDDGASDGNGDSDDGAGDDGANDGGSDDSGGNDDGGSDDSGGNDDGGGSDDDG